MKLMLLAMGTITVGLGVSSVVFLTILIVKELTRVSNK
jgi:hypothetical protein